MTRDPRPPDRTRTRGPRLVAPRVRVSTAEPREPRWVAPASQRAPLASARRACPARVVTPRARAAPAVTPRVWVALAVRHRAGRAATRPATRAWPAAPRDRTRVGAAAAWWNPRRSSHGSARGE